MICYDSFAGKSRSSTIVLSYLIRDRRIPYLEALNFLKEKRNVAEPNKGFTNQLLTFAEKVLNEKCDEKPKQKKCTINKICVIC